MMKTQWSQETYITAWDFATLAHQGQSYAGPVKGVRYDYLNHVGAVAMEVVWALPASPELDGDLALRCALLHDVLEDTDYTKAQLADVFGQAVADGVAALSKNPDLPKAEQMADSLQRIKQQPREVWMVKLADRITNLSEPPYYWQREKKVAYRDEARLIHAQLGAAHPILAGRLAGKISAYQQYIDA